MPETNGVRMAYIDSELVKRRQGTSKPSSTSQNQNDLDELSENGGLIDAGLNRQPAALGKLHEIDLGPDATLRNIARTEAAKRRLEGGGADVDEWTGKVRLRRDGKPYRRKRRNSDDMKRDKLVEEVMRESRREPPPQIPSTPPPRLRPPLQQSKSTTNPKPTSPQTTKPPTTASQNNSAATSWMPFPAAANAPAPPQRSQKRTRTELQGRRRKKRDREVRSWGAVGARGRR